MRKFIMGFLLITGIFLLPCILLSKKETRPASVHLNRYYHMTKVLQNPHILAEVSNLKSDFDGAALRVLVLKPAEGKSDQLIFFFHGMDGDAGDAFIAEDLVNDSKATVICFGGRGAAWLSDAFIADANQIIARYSKDSDGFYLAGISMGGTQALSMAGLLPEPLKKRVKGVIALMPESDLAKAALQSVNQKVLFSLWATSDMQPDKLKTRSAIALLSKYPAALPFAIFYRANDTVLPAGHIKTFIQALRARGNPVSVFWTPGNHEFLYEDFNYKKMTESLGKNLDEKYEDKHAEQEDYSFNRV